MPETRLSTSPPSSGSLLMLSALLLQHIRSKAEAMTILLHWKNFCHPTSNIICSFFFCLGTGRWVGEGGLFLWETKAKQSRINKNTSEIYTYCTWLSDKLSLSCFQCDTFGQLCTASGLVLLYRSQIPHTERIKHMNIRNSASLSERFFNQVSHFNHWFIWI